MLDFKLDFYNQEKQSSEKENNIVELILAEVNEPAIPQLAAAQGKTLLQQKKKQNQIKQIISSLIGINAHRIKTSETKNIHEELHEPSSSTCSSLSSSSMLPSPLKSALLEEENYELRERRPR